MHNSEYRSRFADETFYEVTVSWNNLGVPIVESFGPIPESMLQAITAILKAHMSKYDNSQEPRVTWRRVDIRAYRPPGPKPAPTSSPSDSSSGYGEVTSH